MLIEGSLSLLLLRHIDSNYGMSIDVICDYNCSIIICFYIPCRQNWKEGGRVWIVGKEKEKKEEGEGSGKGKRGGKIKGKEEGEGKYSVP